ncbi:MAG: hypothetical protein JXB47_12235 [Anaerolineae bacterium]|nr:hypothetical protein [Anaerolineae bacterium]
MAIGANSYGSVGEVQAFTRHLLDGASAFNSTTRPTLSEVEKMVDRASAALNAGLAHMGFSIPIVQADAKLVCDEWVVAQVVNMVELTRESLDWSGEAGVEADGNTGAGFAGLSDSAMRFARQNGPGFKRLGCAVDDVVSQGLVFTGERAAGERGDDAAVRTPRFSRSMFQRR